VIKTLALVLIAGMLGGTGHVMLAKGMKTIGDLTEAPASVVGGMVGRAATNPWVLLGVTLQACFFFLYLTLLSRADVSKILPMTAFDYIVVAMLAQLLLAEPVTPARWTGIGFIVLGVFLVSRT
jgi:drug/metabolite transporter (DMT)-like permease